MKALSVVFFFAISAADAHAQQKVLDCNFGAGEITQIRVFKMPNQTYEFDLLTNVGAPLPPQALNADQFKQGQIQFNYFNRFGTFQYFMESPDSSREQDYWIYKVFENQSDNPSIIGTADCRK